MHDDDHDTDSTLANRPLTPGTKAYSGARCDARKAILAPALKRVGKGRGEAPILAKLSALTDALVELYDSNADTAATPIVAECESFFGAIVTRLNDIADAREAK